MKLDPLTTVLVDVDTQVDFVEPEGALYVPSAEKLKPNFAKLVRAARDAGVPVVASADAHADETDTFLPPQTNAD